MQHTTNAVDVANCALLSILAQVDCQITNEWIQSVMTNYIDEFTETLQSGVFDILELAHENRQSGSYFNEDQEPVRVSLISRDQWRSIRGDEPHFPLCRQYESVVRWKLRIAPPVQEEQTEEAARSRITGSERSRISLKRKATLRKKEDKRKTPLKSKLHPSNWVDLDADQSDTQLKREEELRNLQSVMEKKAKEEQEERERIKTEKFKQAKEDKLKAKQVSQQHLTYDSNGRVLIVQKHTPPPIQTKQDLKYQMSQEVKLKKALAYHGQQHQKVKSIYGKDPQFFKKVQKYHGIDNVDKFQPKRNAFITELGEGNFSHSKVRKDHKWKIKPGVKIIEDGHLVKSGGPVHFNKRFSLDSYQILHNEQQEKYKEKRLEERRERGHHSLLQTSASLNVIQTRRASAISERVNLPPIEIGLLAQRPPTSRSIVTSRTLLTQPIKEEQDEGAMMPQVPESYSQRLKRIRSELGRKKILSEGKILRELKLNLNTDTTEAKVGMAIPYSARTTRSSPFKQRKFSRGHLKHLPPPPVGKTTGHGILRQ